MRVTPASHRPEALLYGQTATPPASTESWWVGHPREGFMAEACVVGLVYAGLWGMALHAGLDGAWVVGAVRGGDTCPVSR